MNSLKVQDMNWPPKKPTNNDSIQSRKRSIFDFMLNCGDSEGKFEFGLYKFANSSAAVQSVSHKQGPVQNVDGGDEGRAVEHQAVEIS